MVQFPKPEGSTTWNHNKNKRAKQTKEIRHLSQADFWCLWDHQGNLYGQHKHFGLSTHHTWLEPKFLDCNGYFFCMHKGIHTHTESKQGIKPKRQSFRMPQSWVPCAVQQQKQKSTMKIRTQETSRNKKQKIAKDIATRNSKIEQAPRKEITKSKCYMQRSTKIMQICFI